MAISLGLDIGTNSIGWALVDEDKIIDTGVRIFPVGVMEDSYKKSGTEESKNAARRTARGIRRGYDRFHQRRDRLVSILTELKMLPNEQLMKLPAYELYGLRKKALDEKITPHELGRIFLHLNQRRGFLSNRKTESKTKDDDTGKVKEAIAELQKKLNESHKRTLGEYFYYLFQNKQNIHHPIERIRSRFVSRKMYLDEFDAIWNKQRTYYPSLLTDELKTELRDKTIFYQRPLKSQKGNVKNCPLEPAKKVTPKSSPDFQMFRMWQNIMNLRLTDPESGRSNSPLSPTEREKLAKVMMTTEEIVTKDDDVKPTIKKALGLPTTSTFNEMPNDLKGNVTYARLAKAIGNEVFASLTDQMKYRLWHTIYFATSDDWLTAHAVNTLGLSAEQAKALIKVKFEDGYGRLSAKAIRKILPFMIDGNDYRESMRLAGYIKDSQTAHNKDPYIIRKPGDAIEQIPNPLVKQALCESIRVINAVIKKYGKPDTVKIEMLRSLKKPKTVREKMKRNNDAKDTLRKAYREYLLEKNPHWKFVHDSQILKFELWLEMEFAEHDLAKVASKMDIKEFWKFHYNVSPKDKEKFRLWIECGRLSPYTGKIIPLSDLFSPEIEIEHIIPYSRCLDNSFMNKSLCERTFNAEKSNRSPWEVFGHDPEQWKAFVKRVKHYSKAKQTRFLMKEIKDDFLNSQLTNSSYIATELKSILHTVFDDVQITNGQATAILRRFWGLNTILGSPEENQKTRDDHRHHAVDALAIACTNRTHIQRLSTQSHFNHLGKLTNDAIVPPFEDFHRQATAAIHQILVSYRNKSRLLTKSINRYKWSQSKNTYVKTTSAPRGALHAETLYGQITEPRTNNLRYVIRKGIAGIDKLSQIEDIVDPIIKKILLDAVERNGGDIKAAMKEPLFLESKDGKTRTQIQSVRMFYEANFMEMIRPKENQKLFVEPGDNYCIAIYENPSGKRKFQTVSFYKAIHRARKNEPLFPKSLDDYELLYALKKKDLVLMYEDHPDEIKWDDNYYLSNKLYRVVKFDQNGNIGFSLHYATNVNPERPKEAPKGWVAKKSPGTIKCIPVILTPTGDIIRSQ